MELIIMQSLAPKPDDTTQNKNTQRFKFSLRSAESKI